MKFRNFLAFLLGEGSALLLGSFGTNGLWNRPALLLVHGVTLFLEWIMANLLGHVLALLDINLSTLPVRIVDISADLLGNLLAIFFVNCLTLRMRNLLQGNELILDVKLSLWEMNIKARYSVLGKSCKYFIDAEIPATYAANKTIATISEITVKKTISEWKLFTNCRQ